MLGWPVNLKELTNSTQKVICAGGQPVPNPLRVVQVAVSSGRFLVEPSGLSRYVFQTMAPVARS